MTIAERIAFIIKSHSLTNASFADSLGVQRSNISHILSGRSKPSLDFLQKVLAQYPRVNAGWLVNGQTQHQSTKTPNDQQEVERPHQSREDYSVFESNAAKHQSSSDTLRESHKNSDIEYIMIIYKDGTFRKVTPA